VKYKVTRFKSMTVGLKELEPFIRNGQHLRTGKRFKRFGGALSRELVANWMMCAVVNAGLPAERYSFTSDPQGGDGIIYDNEAQAGMPTEHIMVPPAAPGEMRDIAALIRDAVAKKQAKGGSAYAGGKALVVFLEAGLGLWQPNVAARQLPSTDFREVWVVGLHGEVTDRYTYGVAKLYPLDGNAPVCLVQISPTFDDWTVERLQ
jgi:hypothetical protein